MNHYFPAVSPFLELVQQQAHNPDKIILRDHFLNVTSTAGQLLQSVSRLREKLQTTLLQERINDTGDASDGQFIFILAPPGLEYIVSMLATFSIGAAISAQSIVIKPDEMKRHFNLANPLALLYAPALKEKAEAIKSLCVGEGNGMNPLIPFVEIQANYHHDLESSTYKVEISNNTHYTHAGSLFFTSGTSGNPKGVVHSYQALLASARERIDTWKLTGNDVLLNQKPGNWMGGVFGILPSLMSGACLETCAGVFNPEFFWERMRQGGVSVFDIAPTGYDRLAEYFDQHISVLPVAQKESYIKGMIAARVAGVSGSLLQPHTQRRWTDLRRGKPLLNLYGSTEMTLICSMRWENTKYSDMCCVGQPVSGVEVKLVNDEMLVKAPSMFSRYISDDPTLTEKCLDSDGFFKTGDCAEKIGDSYKIYGRANIDVLHFWGITLRTLEIESALFSLPYIANAVVLPLEDEVYQERAAAILQIKPPFRSKKPNLKTLRIDLTEKTGLMQFKQPTVVYWLQEGEEISLTSNGKISKIDMKKKFFGDNWQFNEQVEIFDVESMEYWRMGGQC